ncbi:unnamed protein product [Urochloa humidicola]
MQAPHNSSPLPSSSSGEMVKKYRGVRRRKWGGWVSEIRLPNSRSRIWLGSFDTPEKAARAFDAAFVCLRGGGGAGLNFPGSPPPDVGRTSDPEKVRAAAMSHANRAAAPPPDDPNATGGGGAPVEAAAAALDEPAAALQVSVPSFDWSRSQLLANNCLSPLFPPTTTSEMESHAYLLPLPVSSPPADVDDMGENESGSCPGLWSFD